MTKPIFIHGEYVPAQSQTHLAIHNPTTLEPLGTVPNCNDADVDKAVKSARQAQYDWWKTPEIEKATMMRAVGQRIRGMEQALAHQLTAETGKPLIESFDCVEWVAACFDYYAETGRSSRGLSLPPVAPHQVNFTIYEPYGVVACIAPFNFPLLLMVWKVAPAIMTGNTVVCKPPHQNPLSTLMLAEAFEALPPGVVNVITGDGPHTGEALLQHPEVDMIAFTGSTPIGKHIASVAGSQLKKINLELGGIDPLLVLDDADLDVAMRGAAWARLLNAGQVCTSSKRIYLVESIADAFIEKLMAYIPNVVVGDPMKPNTDMGPLISEEAAAHVEKQVQKAIAEGAKCLTGGKRFQPNGLKGHFFEPTVLVNVKHGSLPTTEEIFGPVMCLIRVKDNDEAIRLANDSQYGLGATIYTKSLEYAMKAMENIKAGTFWINDPLTDNDAGPFGGMRHSGIGRELGVEGLNAFREPKHVHLDYIQEIKSYWFPYSERPVPDHD